MELECLKKTQSTTSPVVLHIQWQSIQGEICTAGGRHGLVKQEMEKKQNKQFQYR